MFFSIICMLYNKNGNKNIILEYAINMVLFGNFRMLFNYSLLIHHSICFKHIIINDLYN